MNNTSKPLCEHVYINNEVSHQHTWSNASVPTTLISAHRLNSSDQIIQWTLLIQLGIVFGNRDILGKNGRKVIHTNVSRSFHAQESLIRRECGGSWMHDDIDDNASLSRNSAQHHYCPSERRPPMLWSITFEGKFISCFVCLAFAWLFVWFCTSCTWWRTRVVDTVSLSAVVGWLVVVVQLLTAVFIDDVAESLVVKCTKKECSLHACTQGGWGMRASSQCLSSRKHWKWVSIQASSQKDVTLTSGRPSVESTRWRQKTA